MRAQAPPRGRSLVEFEHYGFGGLLNIADGEHEIQDNELRAAVNVYGRVSGDIVMRRGVSVHGSPVGSGAGQGLFRFWQGIANGTVLGVATTLMQVGGTLYNADTGAPLSAINGLGATALPMSIVTVFDNQHPTSPPTASAAALVGSGTLVAGTYGYRVTSNTPGGESLPSLEVTITTTATGRIVLTWNAVPGATSYNVYGRTVGAELQIAATVAGTTYTDNGTATPAGALPTTTTATVAPSDVAIICTGSGGPYVYDGVITYTYAGGPTGVAGARWCLLVNNVLYFAGIPSQPNLVVASRLGFAEQLPGYAVFTTSRPVTGLGTLGQGLQTMVVAGMTRGVALFSGTTPNSYIEQEIPNEDGVAAGRSMLSVDGILYFIGTYAIYRYDGSAFVEISHKVHPWIVNDPMHQSYPMNGVRSASWSMYYERRIYFWYNSGGTATPNTALVWDLDLQGWTIYAGSTFNAGCQLDAPGDADPHAFLVVDATKGQAYQFDVFADAQNNVTDAGATISASFITKNFKIGTAGAVKRLLRTTVEYFSSTFNGLLTVVTDYGVTQQVALAALPSTNLLQWDIGLWDVALWASAELAYNKQRQDWDLAGEAFAFGFQTPNPNTPGVYGLWRFMGVTGRIGQYPRN
jgi:hypothetical protein